MADEQDLYEKTLSTEVLVKGRWLTLYRDEVELSNGQQSYREYLLHPGASVMIALTKDNKILFVKQYRHPSKQIYIELPAGKRDQGEDPMVTAHRELAEETGFKAASMQHLTDVHPCIGYSNEVIHVMLAQDLTHVGTKFDHGEMLIGMELSIEDAMEKIRKGEITDAKTTHALFYYYNFVVMKQKNNHNN